MMDVAITEATAREIERWNKHVRDSSQGLIFHRYEFLRLIEDQTGLDFYPLVGRERGELVGLFPIFRRSKGPVNLVYSPPHGLSIPYLGPVLIERDGEPHDTHCRNNRFIEACLDWIETNIDPSEYFIKTSWRFTDPRPFQRAEFTTVPRYTYTLELSRGEDQLRRSFSKSLRRYLDPETEVECTVPEDGVAALRYIVERTRERYEAQGKSYPLRSRLVEKLYEHLPEGSVRPYVGIVEGERRSGVIALQDEETTHFWAGGGKVDSKVPLNDLIHWRIMRDSIENGLRSYDLVGANTPRICEYKSKFNPELKEYYLVTKQALSTRAYRKLQQNL